MKRTANNRNNILRSSPITTNEMDQFLAKTTSKTSQLKRWQSHKWMRGKPKADFCGNIYLFEFIQFISILCVTEIRRIHHWRNVWRCCIIPFHLHLRELSLFSLRDMFFSVHETFVMCWSYKWYLKMTFISHGKPIMACGTCVRPTLLLLLLLFARLDLFDRKINEKPHERRRSHNIILN